MRSKAYVCSRSIVGFAGSNPADGMNAPSFPFCRVLRKMQFLRRVGHSYRGVLQGVCVCVCVSVCVTVCYLETFTAVGPRSDLGCSATKNS
jgi:hypothetical protein